VTLDKKAAHVVYCHSGRRSWIAADQMAKASFTDNVDGGAMADLVAAGAPTQSGRVARSRFRRTQEPS
jgi:rhodanese-related sulfurtransferase